MHYSFYKDAFEERIAICMENGASLSKAIEIAEQDTENLLQKFESHFYIKNKTVYRIKKELELL